MGGHCRKGGQSTDCDVVQQTKTLARYGQHWLYETEAACVVTGRAADDERVGAGPRDDAFDGGNNGSCSLACDVE
jgi:hypothetical protein